MLAITLTPHAEGEAVVPAITLSAHDEGGAEPPTIKLPIHVEGEAVTPVIILSVRGEEKAVTRPRLRGLAGSRHIHLPAGSPPTKASASTTKEVHRNN